MFFWSLLLAHVIADFPLQTDGIYRIKTKYAWGVLPHVLICSMMNILALLPYLNNVNAWFAVLGLGAVHIILDRTKIRVTERIARDNFFQFFLDQLLHVISIWIIAVWLSQAIDRNAYTITGIFANRELVIQLTAYIFATFAGVPIIFYALKFWFLEVLKLDYAIKYPHFLQRVPGYFERFLATLGIVWGGWWFVLTGAAFLPRLVLKWKDADRSVIYLSAAVGFLVSILSGLAVRLLI